MGAAGAFNNLYDRDIDSIMERTKNRPTATGEIKPKTVLWLGIFMMIFGVIILGFTTSLAALLGFLGLFFYIVPYTMWSKRRTVYNTEVGSIGGAMPPLIGWSAVLSGHHTSCCSRSFCDICDMANASFLCYSHSKK